LAEVAVAIGPRSALSKDVIDQTNAVA